MLYADRRFAPAGKHGRNALSTMFNLKKMIVLWGILDICSIGWYVGWRIFHAQIPFYHDVIKAIETTTSFGIPSLALLTIFSLFLYVSLIFSGVYLIKLHKVGAILSYIQTPFRLLTLIPPSIFFIGWPLKDCFVNPGTISAIGTLLFLVLLSEIFKLWSIIWWHRHRTFA
jgi:hypothetical protein